MEDLLLIRIFSPFFLGMRGKKWDGGEDDNEANLYDQGPNKDILAIVRDSECEAWT